MMKLVTLIVLFSAVAFCQEPIDDDEKAIADEARVGKRGLSLGLGTTGFDGYNNYLNPSTRALYNTRNYNPISDYGYDGVNYGVGASNFAGGSYPGSSYYGQQAYGQYPYGNRGGYPTSYAYQRQYNTPVNTYPLGGIGTVGPYGGAYSGFNSYTGGLNRFGAVDGYNGYNNGYQQQQFGGLF